MSPKTWEYARQALVFYFTRRHGLSGAEDLAHETLASILSREDYQFEKEEDFLKVCYGFASHVLQAAWREPDRSGGNLSNAILAAPSRKTQGLNDAELSVYLDEALRLGKEQLRDVDWQLIQQSLVLEGDRSGVELDPTAANKARVKLHRARRKLAKLAGWRKS
ncbi:MAG TPA: hypothetical protein VIX89_01280 [Bryobacteraceae bacterium]